MALSGILTLVEVEPIVLEMMEAGVTEVNVVDMTEVALIVLDGITYFEVAPVAATTVAELELIIPK